jgi:hypothetical protein
VIYHLSSAQHKQLTDRFGPLLIALPAPEDDPPDWLAWARSVISEKHRAYVVAAVPTVITVGPSRADGLTGVIGEIEPPDKSFSWGVEVVLCDLDPPGKSRHPRSRPQWPASVDTQTASGRWPRERSR